jgi:hypothetical protein
VIEPGETPIARARMARGWSKAEVCRRLQAARRKRGMQPPREASLKRMYIDWESGKTQVVDWQGEFCDVFVLTASALGFSEQPVPGPITELLAPALEITKLDPVLVRLLDEPTNHYRMLDRRLGAALIPQTAAHVEQMQSLLHTALDGGHRRDLAVALAEAAALSGWQSLDAGDVRRAWQMHEMAKAAAREGEDPTVLAHVTAQQAYALLDAQRASEAAQLGEYAASQTAGRLPARLQAWLSMAQAEFYAANGQELQARRLLEAADNVLPAGDADPDLPYLMLNAAHLARWRGHCLARLGSIEAVSDLEAALDGIEPGTATRAEASLRVDLAIALHARGEVTDVHQQAVLARELAGRSGSQRQRVRIERLLAVDGGPA